MTGLLILVVVFATVAGLIGLFRAATGPLTAAERMEQAADYERELTDALHAAHGARLDPHPPYRPATAPPRVTAASQYRRTCDELGACQDRAACRACPQRTAIPTTTLHRQP